MEQKKSQEVIERITFTFSEEEILQKLQIPRDEYDTVEMEFDRKEGSLYIYLERKNASGEIFSDNQLKLLSMNLTDLYSNENHQSILSKKAFEEIRKSGFQNLNELFISKKEVLYFEKKLTRNVIDEFIELFNQYKLSW